ncbi:WxL domain-containing protein, partial [Listeria monocytogenes]
MIFKKTLIVGLISISSVTLFAPSAFAVTSEGDSKATVKFKA